MFILVLFAVFYFVFYILLSLNVQNMCVKTASLLWHSVIKLLIDTCLMNSIRWDDQPLKDAREVLYNPETSSFLCWHQEWRLGVFIQIHFSLFFLIFCVFPELNLSLCVFHWLQHYVFTLYNTHTAASQLFFFFPECKPLDQNLSSTSKH